METYTIFMIVFSIIFGAIIGSFLTVCIFRIPFGRPKGPPSMDEEDDVNQVEEAENKKLTLTSPKRSFCPNCDAELSWYHNIPILSYLALGGKCAFCKQKIPSRYLMVELLSSLAALASFVAYGQTPTALGVFITLCILIVISFIDIEYYIIPDVISLPLIVIGPIVAVLNNYFHFLHEPFAESFLESGVGLLVAGGFLWLISEVYYRLRGRVGLGFGDVKLLAWFGAFFGVSGAFCALFFGSIIGTVLGLFLMVFAKKGFAHQLPFGPYLAVGLIMYLFGFNPFRI